MHEFDLFFFSSCALGGWRGDEEDSLPLIWPLETTLLGRRGRVAQRKVIGRWVLLSLFISNENVKWLAGKRYNEEGVDNLR
jgi:hypothetical protein